MRIGVTGATGQLGRLVVARLKAMGLGQETAALVRTPERAAGLGVAVREADYDRPETLAAAMEGLETVLLISSNELGRRGRQHRNVMEAAKRAGVRHVVYTSLLHADTSPLSLAGEHRETEQALRDGGVQWTILRNGWYVENFSDRITAAARSGVLVGCAGAGRIAAAARADYADAAAAALVSEEHAGRIYELAGDEAWTMEELATEIARQAGRPACYRDLSEEQYAAALAAQGMPEPVARLLAGFDAAAARGALFDGSRQLSALIGRPTMTLGDAVARALRGNRGDR